VERVAKSASADCGLRLVVLALAPLPLTPSPLDPLPLAPLPLVAPLPLAPLPLVAAPLVFAPLVAAPSVADGLGLAPGVIYTPAPHLGGLGVNNSSKEHMLLILLFSRHLSEPAAQDLLQSSEQSLSRMQSCFAFVSVHALSASSTCCERDSAFEGLFNKRSNPRNEDASGEPIIAAVTSSSNGHCTGIWHAKSQVTVVTRQAKKRAGTKRGMVLPDNRACKSDQVV